jgi:hypothetical protein
LAAAVLFLFASLAQAHQLVVTTGYASSSTPKTGSGIDQNAPPVAGGGGFAVGVRVDLDNPSRRLWISPSFLFWNDLTGSPAHDFNANYFQIELGGRLSVHSRSVPMLYGGVGAGYTVAHCTVAPRYVSNVPTDTYDGNFPSASVHGGVKLPNPTSGITVLAEASYHLGLAQSRGFHSIGPARTALIQIGVGFDIVSGRK